MRGILALSIKLTESDVELILWAIIAGCVACFLAFLTLAIVSTARKKKKPRSRKALSGKKLDTESSANVDAFDEWLKRHDI